MKRVDFYLTETEIKGLNIIAEKTGKGKSELIRRAVDEFISKKKWEGMEGLKDLDI